MSDFRYRILYLLCFVMIVLGSKNEDNYLLFWVGIVGLLVVSLAWLKSLTGFRCGRKK